jgi:hypothetical protein
MLTSEEAEVMEQAMTSEPKLPELPPHEGSINLFRSMSIQQVNGYTAAQMQAYARAAVEQATEGEARGGETLKFALVAVRLLQGFMLDTNAVGAETAGKYLARGIKEYLVNYQAMKESKP